MTVGEIIAEPLIVHRLAKGKALDKRVDELLYLVGLSSEHARRYPRSFPVGNAKELGLPGLWLLILN